MAVFNCAPFENEDSVELEVTTQTGDQDTGELAVTDSLKIKGVDGVSVSVDGDTVVFGIDPETFPESDAGDGGTDSGDTSGDSTGGGSTGGSGCTCPNIYTANSVEELPDPATVPEGSLGFVPSKGGESSGNQSGGGGTDTVSWNDLTDKPFGDESVTIEWDGSTDGHTLIPLSGNTKGIKVSNLTPEPEELINGEIRVLRADGVTENITITADAITDYRSMGYNMLMIGEFITIVVYEDNLNVEGLVFPEKGIYFGFNSATGAEGQYLTYGSLKKLDAKYLSFVSDSTETIYARTFATSNGLYSEDGLPSLTRGELVTVEWDGAEYHCEVKDGESSDIEGVCIGNRYIGNKNWENTGEPFYIVVAVGRVVIQTTDADGEHTVKIYTGSTEYVKIPKECLPDDIGGTGFGLPVVELTTMITYCNENTPSTTTVLSKSEGAELSEAAQTGLPVVVKWAYDSLFTFGSLGNNFGDTWLELGFVYQNVKGVVCYNGAISGWEFRLTWNSNA